MKGALLIAVGFCIMFVASCGVAGVWVAVQAWGLLIGACLIGWGTAKLS